jgi:hypothetical protein
MATVRDVKIRLRGINQLMRSREVQAVVDREGRRLAERAGPDFRYVPSPHRWTARGFVEPANLRGARAQAKDAVLERALGSR